MTYLSRTFVFSVVMIFTIVYRANANTPPVYSFTTITDPSAGSNGTYVYGINNAGQIVGNTGGEGHGNPSGFVLSAGIFTPIDDPLAAYGTSAHGINNAGQIAGWYQSGPTGNTARGFVYSGGVYTTLNVPSSIYSHAQGINDAGEVVGDYVSTDGNYHGFLYNNGVYTTLDDPNAIPVNSGGQTFTLATGISNSGQIVGWYQDPNGTHGFLYSGGVYTTVDVPLATATIAESINNLGQIVGWYQAAGRNHGFLNSNGDYTTLDDPSAPLGVTLAWGINDSSEIVGYDVYNGGNPNVAQGFLATPQVGYNVCLLYDPTKSAHSGSTIPIKIQLCDGTGNDVSSPKIVVHVVQIQQASSSITGPAEAAGNANPDNDFRYDPELGPTGGYILNLKTTGLTTGTYLLQFTASGDPVAHAVSFQVK